MSIYDIYLKKPHPDWLTKLFLKYNANILESLISYFPKKTKISILELGPGKGYFYAACSKKNNIKYSALDRNRLMLKNLGIKNTFIFTLPKFPILPQKFDIIYAAYLVEHLKNGGEVRELIEGSKKYLHQGGLIVFLAPDALRQKFEFYNADYTHMYPVTKRAVNMAFEDCGFKNIEIFELTDIALFLTRRNNLWNLISKIIQIAFYLYDYNLVNTLAYPFYRKKVHEIDNWFYRIYSFTKVWNLLFIVKNE